MSELEKLQSARVPSNRRSRLFKMGSLAGRVATNVIFEGGKQFAQGKRPKTSELLLTPNNMNQLADKLSRMRGAAMKLGQLLSMDAGTLLPPELSAALVRLQSQGMVMPKTQLLETLELNWGAEWMDKFNYFSFDPVAAASIGQVHEARTGEGEHLAIKIQFPGVRESIDSDVDNLLSLLRLSGLIPKTLEIDHLVQEARAQLKAEADYTQEGQWMMEFNQLIGRSPLQTEVLIPQLQTELSSENILAMSFLPGVDLEEWIKTDRSRASKELGRLLSLFFTELLQFRLMQTDPNPANFRVAPDSGRLILYDFGAVRSFSPEFVTKYHRAIEAAINKDEEALEASLHELGFFSQQIDPHRLKVILQIFMLAGEPLRHEGEYDFGASDLAKRIQELGMSLSRDPDAWHTPPADVLFLHRKMGGIYLMAAKYGAKVDAGEIYRGVTQAL